MIIPEQSTLGILGGGQLGQMFTLVARSMGYQVICYEPNAECPTHGIANEHICAPFDDESALESFAKQCDAITFEFENIPVETVEFLEKSCPVHPSSKALSLAQNRITEKNHLNSIGLATTDYACIENMSGLEKAWQQINRPAILKTTTLGYDGKGQVAVDDFEALQQAYQSMGNRQAILEAKADLAQEISVILCRNQSGQQAVFPVAENIHVNGILDTTIAPARTQTQITEKAQKMAASLADSMQYIGVLAVEFFLTHEQKLLVNEMAPRPHNSGHYTIDACLTSQFEQQVRMMCGLTPGSTVLHTPVVMKNLLGDLWRNSTPEWQNILREDNCKLHLYGKNGAAPGRKMGHFCCLANQQEAAIKLTTNVMNKLNV
jgi:5-(carboxyamino)imidazole ribonucleotide synthase